VGTDESEGGDERRITAIGPTLSHSRGGIQDALQETKDGVEPGIAGVTGAERE
jgi:hypothetical protein